MRIKLVILAAAGSLALASASWAGVARTSVSTESSVHLVAAKTKQRPPMSVGDFKASGGRVKDAGHTGCTHGNDGLDHCTQYCIESASGSMCVDDVACYYKGEQVPCS